MELTKEQLKTAKERAFELFVQTDLTQTKISDIVKVSEKTMSLWVNDNVENWKGQRNSYSANRQNLSNQYANMLLDLNRQITSRADGWRFPTEDEVKIINSLSANLDRFGKKFDYSLYYDVLNQFTDFLLEIDIEKANLFAPLILEFLKIKHKKC
jgi:transposase